MSAPFTLTEADRARYALAAVRLAEEYLAHGLNPARYRHAERYARLVDREFAEIVDMVANW